MTGRYARAMQRRRLSVRIGLLAVALGALLAGPSAALGESPPPGPPFPAPVAGTYVYDYAGVFSDDTIRRAQETIAAIRDRTGAEVAVYTQVVGYGVTTAQAESDAHELMRQWGVGRKGIDDGLVILYDLDPTKVHGQVELWAGSGYRAAYLDDGERQRLYDEKMLPLLKAGDLSGALLIALDTISANATPEHAATLERARQFNAILGLLVAPLLLVLLVGWIVFEWLRYGRDPVYLDSPSIHIPAPPKGMTAATGALVYEGTTPSRAFTAALLDLASRGRVAFEEDPDAPKEYRPAGADRAFRILLGSKARALATEEVETAPRSRPAWLGGQESASGAAEAPASAAAAETKAQGDAIASARLSLEDRRPLGPAETQLLADLGGLSVAEAIDPPQLPELATKKSAFEKSLEQGAVDLGWFRQRPASVMGRWRAWGVGEAVLGGVAAYGGLTIPMSGLTVVGAGLIVAGIVTFVIAGFMPARTMSGAMARAWLAAYRRTLQKTMAASQSLTQVVQDPELQWLETPDQAVVWATALGLTHELTDILTRSADPSTTSSGIGYVPLWYRTAGGGLVTTGSGGGGLFSASGIPDFGGMVSALGTIGSAPASSSSGGFGGGGGGGGGGGAGGGF